MNRIDTLFENKQGRVLSVFYTAGFPKLNDTISIAVELEKAGVDMLEIGIPYSDPLADGEVIQRSSAKALDNGMSLSLLMDQLSELRNHCDLPVLLMGYLNPILQFGFEEFCKTCSEVGVDGLIIPDLPLDEAEELQPVFKWHGLKCVLLATQQTPENRLKRILKLSTGFVYMVSSAAITGGKSGFGQEQVNYFKRISIEKHQLPVIAGFGIHDETTFNTVCEFVEGGIVGSHFIRLLEKNSIQEASSQLFTDIKPGS